MIAMSDIKNAQIIYGLNKNAKALQMIGVLVITGARPEHISEELTDRINTLNLIKSCLDGKISEQELGREMDRIDLTGAKRNLKAAEKEGMQKETVQRLLKEIEEKEQELNNNETRTT